MRAAEQRWQENVSLRRFVACCQFLAGFLCTHAFLFVRQCGPLQTPVTATHFCWH